MADSPGEPMNAIVFWIVAAVVVVGVLVAAFAYDRVRRNSRRAAQDGPPGNAHSQDVIVQQEHYRNADQSRDW